MTNNLKADALYIGDNGACYCGAHSGYTAQTTGRGISGQKVMRVTPAMLAAEGIDAELHCGIPSCAVKVVRS